MKRAFALAAAAVAVTMTPTAAYAVTDVPIGTDANWDISGPGSTVLTTRVPTAAERPSVWAPNQPGSVWISPDLGDGAAFPNQGSSPAGLYNFRGFVTLSDVGNVQTWTTTWWADNIVRRILVNGTEIYSDLGGSSQAQQFGGAGISRIFTNSVWVNGSNFVDFEVENGTGLNGNPLGLQVNGLLSAVPEPGTWMLMILGLGAVGFAMRRRQKTAIRFQFA
jgi:hypothetical protein